jgi:uncharacterized membrane protein
VTLRIAPLAPWVALIVLVGCIGPPASPTEEAGATSVLRIDGTLDLGDAQSDWSAVFESGEIRQVTEQVGAGDYGESTARFRYTATELIRYEETGQRKTPGQPAREVELRLEFESGAFVRGTKSVDRSPVEPEPYEVEGALRRAESLRLQAILRRDNPPPQLRCQGNEPFWNLEIVDTKGRWSALGDDGPRTLRARWHWDPSTTPASLDWRSRDVDDRLFVFAVVTEETCLDSMSDETPPFSHRITVQVSGRGAATGCCRSTR